MYIRHRNIFNIEVIHCVTAGFDIIQTFTKDFWQKHYVQI